MRLWRRGAGCDPTSLALLQQPLVPLDPATLQPLPNTLTLSGVLEILVFFRDSDFVSSIDRGTLLVWVWQLDQRAGARQEAQAAPAGSG